ncbi:conserved hypothetical protein [Histoplasma capsulatum G186AR]|uniref:Uncharacterized protein n=2 Tax=Ajellomyces capsulatus TaxID=5037 RepID=C0NLG7_AJECG|nr:uncharacterized protein HCBG_04347 [Histoplasma capsulatum G186AR]EEH07468.1 conserved hypothetical protein [Histoplasma capsulatum G186AR]KAG5304382.1 acetyl coenzyme A synthetase (ADP forming), alpha domain-containing protein [Histoplasma capsulatum]QSS69980.1 acetyl coenzyme A synthetase (ADP forming), alpha domain-containing protein [Histoplasma capsulatum G186AR]
MAFCEAAMPGTFILDSPIPPKLDLAGARSQFYRSPQTPSAASSLCRSVGQEHQGSRKRARHGYDEMNGDVSGGFGTSSLENGTPVTAAAVSMWGNHSMMSTATTASSFSRIASPTPLVNTDYRFAGDVDYSSTMMTMSGFEKSGDEAYGPEVDYRPNRYREMIHAPIDSPSLGFLPPVGAGRDWNGNTRKRGRRESLLQERDDGLSPDGSRYDNGNTNHDSWGAAVVKIVGGVAGKVWDFCWSGPFRGFYAGGGKGYDMGSEAQQPPSPLPSRVVEEASTWQSVYEKADVFSSSGGKRDDRIATVPGCFPIESSHNNARLLHDCHDELQANWVLVRNAKKAEDGQGADVSPSSAYSSSARKIARKSNHPVSPRRVAVGRLSRRQSLLTPTRTPSSYSPSHQHPNYHQLASSNGQASCEPTKSNNPSKYGNSPASIEAQRLAARAKRREREEDASIRRLNQQLKAMIKEGKEALGTTIEIEDDGIDMEGWD